MKKIACPVCGDLNATLEIYTLDMGEGVKVVICPVCALNSPVKGGNPDNPKQMILFFDLRTAYEYGEKRHPQIVMRELAEKYHFTILARIPQTFFDGWDFWIEFETMPMLPPIFRHVPWKPIGEA